MPSDVYLVIPSSGIGGAEKRFAGLWQHLRNSGANHITLVAPKALLDIFRGTAEFPRIAQSNEGIIEVNGGTPELRSTLTSLFKKNPRAVFHHALWTPVLAQRFVSRRTVFTIPTARLDVLNWKGLAGTVAGAATAGVVDILDEPVFNQVRQWLPWRKRSIFLTPSSFVDLKAYVPAAQKRPKLVFCGLFTKEKQVYRLLDAVPAIDAALKRAGIAQPEFRFLGRETQSPGVEDTCAALRPTGIDIRSWFEPNPQKELADATVFFSVQERTNYPSRSTLEALACGCLTVATDVGDTRRIVRDDFGFFVPGHFSPDEIAAVTVSAMTLSEAQRQDRVKAARAFLHERFSVDTAARYYLDLYAKAEQRHAIPIAV